MSWSKRVEKQLNRRRVWGSGLERRISVREETGVEIGHVKVGNVRLRYGLRRGEGTPLLLCNGIGANIELALPLIKELPPRPVVIVDVPGTGGSAPALFWPKLPRYGRWLVKVMDKIGFDGPFAVAGVSWGGGLAQRIALDYPDRVSHLILMATSPGVVMVPGRVSALLRMVTPQRYLSPDFMARNAGTLYGGEFRRNTRGAIAHAGLTKAPTTSAYIQQLLAMTQFSSLTWLRKIDCPSLVLTGDDDPLINPLNGRILAGLMPNSKLHIIRGGGHLFMTMRAAETAKLIHEHLSD